MATTQDEIRNAVSYITNALSLDWEPEDPADPDPRGEAKVPVEKLPILLHELTHSQCFLTVVGKTFRDLWQLILAATRDPQLERQLGEGSMPSDLLRLMQNLAAGVIVYEPWTEGLALFAEWDGLPGNSPAASKAMVQASTLYFLNCSAATPEAMWASFAEDVTRARRLPHLRLRKTNLLSVGIDEPKGHYLAGYLGVKALHRKAVAGSQRFADSDFFCSFATLILFHDPVAATILLDIDTPFSEWLGRLERRLSDRLSVFGAANLDTRAHQHEIATVTHSDVAPAAVAKADSAPLPKDISAAIERFAQIRGAMDQVTKDNNESAGISSEEWGAQFTKHLELLIHFTPEGDESLKLEYLQILQSALKHRVFIRLRRKTGRAIAGSSDVTLINAAGKVVARVDKDPRVPSGLSHEEATYVFYFYPQQLLFFRIMYAMFKEGPKYFGATLYNLGTEPDARQVELYRNSIMDNERIEYNRTSPGGQEEVLQLLDRCLTSAEETQSRRTGLKLALEPLLGGLEARQRSELTKKLSPLGIFGWLGTAPSTVEAVTLLSLHANECCSTQQVRERLAGEGIDWASLADCLDDFGKRHQLHLWQELDIDGKSVLMSAF